MTALPPSDWPHRHRSRAVRAAGVDWHLQLAGFEHTAGAPAPLCVLLHGSGGSAHSWHRVLEPLAARARVIAIDLPGHGWSAVSAARDADGQVYSVEGMATAIAELLAILPARLPELGGATLDHAIVAGHSAGFAVALRMALRAALDGRAAPRAIVGFNPAIVAPPAAYLALVAPLLAPMVESTFAAESAAFLVRATGIVDRLLDSTGSKLDRADRARYATLCGRATHCHAALSMFARWDLATLLRDATRLTVPVTLVAGADDAWIPLAELRQAATRIPGAVLTVVARAGHLIPEERPDVVIDTLQSVDAASARRDAST